MSPRDDLLTITRHRLNMLTYPYCAVPCICGSKVFEQYCIFDNYRTHTRLHWLSQNRTYRAPCAVLRPLFCNSLTQNNYCSEKIEFDWKTRITICDLQQIPHTKEHIKWSSKARSWRDNEYGPQYNDRCSESFVWDSVTKVRIQTIAGSTLDLRCEICLLKVTLSYNNVYQ